MIDHSEQRLVQHTPRNLYDLVVDVAAYPEFLPWCLAARVREKSDTHMVADLLIGFRLYRRRFTSQVTCDPKKLAIDVVYTEGPLRHLSNSWRFLPSANDSVNDSNACVIDFHVAFLFQSPVFQSMMERMFSHAVMRMVTAFEARADALYAPKQPHPANAETSMRKAW